MKRDISVEISEECIHFFLDGTYLGMLVFAKGELSDFRAIVRKNKLVLAGSDLRKVLETGLYELLTHFFFEREHVGLDRLQALKTELVQANKSVLDAASKDIEQQMVKH